MTYWITKYALTKGIQEVEGEECGDGMLRVGRYEYYGKKEWYRSKVQAIAQAESLKFKKVDSLIKQLDRIRSLTFQ